MAANQKRRWSQHVAATSDALDLKPGLFTARDPKEIARSLKRSAEQSERRTSDPFRSAMSMLSFYINRAGRTLSEAQQRRLEAAKDELRALYDRPAAKPRAKRSVRTNARAAPRRSRS
jgi:hypothetical protein